MGTPERIPYQPITERRRLVLPRGARVVVFCVVNLEEWVFDAPIPRPAVPPPAGGPGPVPDVPNWAWDEYGMRVGFWRLLTCLERHAGAAVTVALNAHVCRSYPAIVKACVDAGWEIMGHGVVPRPMTREPDEAAAVSQNGSGTSISTDGRRPHRADGHRSRPAPAPPPALGRGVVPRLPRPHRAAPAPSELRWGSRRR